MTIQINNIGSREEKKKATFTINAKNFEELKQILKSQKKKLSPVIDDLIKLYIDEQKSLIK